MKFFNKINGDFIKRGIILLSVIIGINIVYIGGNKYNKKIDNENTDKNYYDNYFSNDYKRIWPVKIKNIIITSNYGPRINPVTKRQSFHSGIDIGVRQGDNLYAVSSGIIIFSGFKGAYRIYNYFKIWRIWIYVYTFRT